jgi:NifU-like protein involved in Fe-S cluster formation
VYSPQVLDHFDHPRNAGVLDSPDATVQLENPACGDILMLSVRFSQQRIAEMRFQAKGCVPAIACGSALTELVAGKTLTDAAKINREQLVRKLGGLPEASQHASHLAMDALAALIKELRSQTGRVPSGQ